MQRIGLTLSAALAVALSGCSGDNGNGNAGGAGGSAGAGGTGGRGGSAATGGSSGTGGSAGTGGIAGTGGARQPDAGRRDMGRGPDSGRTPDGGRRDGGGADMSGAASVSPMMSFFVTSVGAGNGGDLGGLAGADRKCQELATAVGVGNKTWKAYLSSSTENARDRIGAGPWRNARGVVIAENVQTLHDQGMNRMGGALAQTWPRGAQAVNLILDEKGNAVPSGGAAGQRHDIMTGSTIAGMVDGNNHCNNWMSTTGNARNGHSNRTGGGQFPDSWNSAHTVGCRPIVGNQNFEEGTVSSGGGRGSIYCFATN
jgi:hypothetical protein